MDIDGGEVGVLRAAAKRLLGVPGLRWIIETHSLELERECVSILGITAGYSMTIIQKAWWHPSYRNRGSANTTNG